jgi:hemerythrin
VAIQWTAKLAIGVPNIDVQHRELFTRVNCLLTALEAKRSFAELDEMVVFLGDYVVTHFGSEERLMQETAYPDFPAHKHAHAAFVNDFERLRADLARFGPTPAAIFALNQRVCSWLTDHVARTDRALGAFLAQRSKPKAIVA